MNKVEKLITENAMRIAKNKSRFITSKNDIIEATINVTSSKGDELRSMVDGVEAFNKMKRGN